MFTKSKVETVSKQAKAMTGDLYGLQGIGSDIGMGTRYIDGRVQKVWFGPKGARQCASYYLGVIDGRNPGAESDLPEAVNAVRAELRARGWSQEEYDRGRHDVQGSERFGRLPARS